jgi:hypothetical protein
VRIKSQFKDYYDHMQKYVVGQSTVWNRSWCSMSSELPTPRVGNCGRQCYIGFCGKTYGFLQCYWEYRDWKTGKKEEHEWIAWNIESTLTPRQKRNNHILGLEIRRRIEPCFRVVEDNSIFIAENTPIFVITPWEQVCCPLFPTNHEQYGETLKTLGFNEVVEAKDAYNDLINYIDFLGREHKEVPDMDDKVKIKSHGFDERSFRTK